MNNCNQNPLNLLENSHIFNIKNKKEFEGKMKLFMNYSSS